MRHTQRCIGGAGDEGITRASGLPLGETRTRLHDQSDPHLVSLDPGPFGGLCRRPSCWADGPVLSPGPFAVGIEVSNVSMRGKACRPIQQGQVF
jgi:hypothetical protein